MDRDTVKLKIEETLKELFSKLDIQAEIKFPEERNSVENRFYVEIESEENKNILIGYHGETLNALQHLINVVLFKDYNESFGVIIDVADYRKERERKLTDLAENASEKAKFINKSVALYPMNSYERKIVHDKISEIEGVTSYSEGEGYNRRVIISPEEREE